MTETTSPPGISLLTFSSTDDCGCNAFYLGEGPPPIPPMFSCHVPAQQKF